MDKFNRHKLILDLIKNNTIETQKDLLELLKDYKVDATQATISRDIKELRITKIQTDRGTYKYAVQTSDFEDSNSKYKKIFNISYESILIGESFIAIKCLECTGKICAKYIEGLNLEGVLCFMYDDNTVIIFIEDKDKISEITSEIKSLVE